MSEPNQRPVLRVVSGSPTAEELAALTAVVAAAGAEDARPVERVRRGGWNDPSAQHRRPLNPGPNAWRSSV
jgi:hypothetical protein